MTSSDDEQEKISKELQCLSLKRQQLLERKKYLCLFQELKNRLEFQQTGEKVASNQPEIDAIDFSLKQMSDRKSKLQKRYDSILSGNNNNNNSSRIKHVSFNTSQTTVPPEPEPEPEPEPVSDTGIFYIEDPPAVPAPEVFLDVEKLPPCPCRTQCPACRQFVTTETFTSVSSFTWQACFITALIGCVAGCCLIPFCLDSFKSTTHRCPKCRTSIRTIKKF